MTEGLADDRIHFVNFQLLFQHQFNTVGQIKHTDAVADKVRSVFTNNNTLTQGFFTEFHHKINNIFIRFLAGNDFHEFHVARRIKEMGSQKAFFHSGAEFRADVFNGNTGGVCRNDAGWFDHFFHFGKKFLLDFEILNNNLANPVYVSQPLQIVLEVADGDHGCIFLAEETGGFRLRYSGKTICRESISPCRTFFRQACLLVSICQFEWDDIEQVALDTGIGQMSRDARTHDSRT